MSADHLDGVSTSHRGIRWHRDVTGRVTWFNDELNQWVRWRPGVDAPPRPPGWGPSEPASSAAAPLSRPRWRSPYRLVPLVLVAFVLVIGGVQALKTTNPTMAESIAAHKLQGRCLHQNGTSAGHPRYAAASVSCTSPGADVKVVTVLPGAPGSPSCPAATTAVQLAYAGVRFPHVECVQRVVGTSPSG